MMTSIVFIYFKTTLSTRLNSTSDGKGEENTF